jgi:chorismate mutase
MQEIDKLRAEMDQIHIELGLLLQKRLDLTLKIWRIKKAEHLPLVDMNREEFILQNIKNSVTDSDQQIFLTQVFKNILVETKKYLEAKLK